MWVLFHVPCPTPDGRAARDLYQVRVDRIDDAMRASAREHGCTFHRAWHVADGSAFYAVAHWRTRLERRPPRQQGGTMSSSITARRAAASGGPGGNRLSLRKEADARQKLLRSLFDYSFSTFITSRVIRVLYVLTTIIVALWTLVFVLAAFRSSTGLGIVALLIGAPLFFVFTMIYARVVLELIMVIFRIHEDVDDINQRGAGAVTPEPEAGYEPSPAATPEPPAAAAPATLSSPAPEAAPEPQAVAQFCEDCGAERKPDKRFCVACGTAFA